MKVLAGCEDPDKINGAQKLGPTTKLSMLFTEPVDEHVHIVVRCPDSEKETVEEERRDDVSVLHKSGRVFFFLFSSINTIHQGSKTSSRAFRKRRLLPIQQSHPCTRNLRSPTPSMTAATRRTNPGRVSRFLFNCFTLHSDISWII